MILFRYMSTHTFLTNLDFRLNWTFLFVSCTITIGNFEIMICLMFFSKELVEDFRLKEGYSRVLNIPKCNTFNVFGKFSSY